MADVFISNSAHPPAIDSCTAFVLIFSPRANASKQVARELHLAQSEGRAHVIPFRIEAVRPEGALRYLLSGLHWLDALAEPRDAQIGELIGRLREGPASDAIAPAATDAAAGETLPAELTSFHGRDREERELAALLERHRVVTLVGAGGVGKTRLAVRAGRALRERIASCLGEPAAESGARGPSMSIRDVSQIVTALQA